ncbi:MAG TPA: site-2 protease family protein [Geminicoccaceae bacterium]|nr:site-2 protease family protein [Geminicoccus sp.]HMU53010.1 site-2 protease family protein [Geminicoccaceae bacterium]
MSRQPFFSHSWHRVAGVRPRLKAHARIHPQRFRGETWYVLQDPQSGRFHRLSAAANLAICLMDGRRTVSAIWDLAGAKLGAEQPTQDEMIRLLGQLHAADLLTGDLPADIGELVRRGDRQARRELMGRLRNPIAFRISLLDPDGLLSATLPLVAPLFSVGGFLLWLAVVAGGAVLATLHWDGLTADVADHALAPSNIVLMLLVYPVLKGLHELGHGWAAKRWGGEVHEIGIMLLVFFPVPYVDASDAAGFASKWQRAIVGAAGMMVELLIAVVALAVWVTVEPGLVRALAFSIMLIAGVSTLLFNGNPLLRYDGYYVLGDLIEIPNLGPRSNQYLGYLAKRWLLGVKDARSPVTARGEPFWFVLYGVAAFAYRLAITLVIALYLSTKAFLLGALLAIVAIGTAVVLPMLRGLRYLLISPDLRQTRGRAIAVVTLLALVVAGSAFAVPAPYATIVEGVVWMPENGLVRAGTGGAVGRVVATPGGTVQPGDPLVELEDPLLDARIASLAAQQREVQLRLEAAKVSDMVSAEMYRQQLAHVGAALDQERRRKADLVVRAGASGRFVLPKAQDLPGHIVERGAVLGYIVNSERPMVRALASQDDIDLILRRAGQIEARFVQRPELSYAAVQQRMIPGTVESLPSPVLGAEGGGPWVEIPTGPDGRRRLVQEAFLLDFVVEGEVPGGTIGSRVHLRIDHGPEAVGWRVLRSLRQLFLRQLDV